MEETLSIISEDLLVAGMCAAIDTLGMPQHAGVETTIKHLAFNNQEENHVHINKCTCQRKSCQRNLSEMV